MNENCTKTENNPWHWTEPVDNSLTDDSELIK